MGRSHVFVSRVYLSYTEVGPLLRDQAGLTFREGCEGREYEEVGFGCQV